MVGHAFWVISLGDKVATKLIWSEEQWYDFQNQTRKLLLTGNLKGSAGLWYAHTLWTKEDYLQQYQLTLQWKTWNCITTAKGGSDAQNISGRQYSSSLEKGWHLFYVFWTQDNLNNTAEGNLLCHNAHQSMYWHVHYYIKPLCSFLSNKPCFIWSDNHI